MRAWSFVLCLSAVLLYEIRVTHSQTAYCVFGRTGDGGGLNGLYTASTATWSGATQNGKSVYRYDGSSTCSGTRYLFWTGSTWRVNTDYTSGYYSAYCNSNSEDITQCDGNWLVAETSGAVLDTNIRVYADMCPEWQCDAITTSIAGNCGGPFANRIEVNHYEDDNGLAFYYHRAFSSWVCGPYTQDWCYSVSLNYRTEASAVWQPVTLGNSVSVTFSPSTPGTINCVYDANATPFPTLVPTTARPTTTTLPPNVPTAPTTPAPVPAGTAGTACVWNSLRYGNNGAFSYYGEINLYPGWRKQSPHSSCEPTTMYLCRKTGVAQGPWRLAKQVNCDEPYAWCTQSDVSACTAGQWTSWALDSSGAGVEEADPDMYVSMGECPSWDCDSVRVDMPALSPLTGQTFETQIEPNVWRNSGGYVFAFNPHWFDWRVISLASSDYNACGSVLNRYTTRTTDELWKDVASGSSVSFTFEGFEASTSGTYPVACVGTSTLTPAPTTPSPTTPAPTTPAPTTPAPTTPAPTTPSPTTPAPTTPSPTTPAPVTAPVTSTTPAPVLAPVVSTTTMQPTMDPTTRFPTQASQTPPSGTPAQIHIWDGSLYGLNGQYTYYTEVNGAAAYKKDSPDAASCEPAAMFLCKTTSTLPFGAPWRITSSPTCSGTYFAWCPLDNLIDCGASEWDSWSAAGTIQVDTHMYYADGEAPRWNCSSIKLYGLPLLSTLGLEEVFDTQIGRNAWQNSQGYVWAFNPFLYEWRLLDGNSDDYRDCEHTYLARTHDTEWRIYDTSTHSASTPSATTMAFAYPGGTMASTDYQVECNGVSSWVDGAVSTTGTPTTTSTTPAPVSTTGTSSTTAPVFTIGTLASPTSSPTTTTILSTTASSETTTEMTTSNGSSTTEEIIVEDGDGDGDVDVDGDGDGDKSRADAIRDWMDRLGWIWWAIVFGLAALVLCCILVCCVCLCMKRKKQYEQMDELENDNYGGGASYHPNW